MRSATLLDHASELLRRVLRFDAPADAAVAAFFREQPSLGSRDRHALSDMVYRVLRERRLVEHLAAQIGEGAFERRLALVAGGDALGSIDRASLPDALRHNLPDWLAGALARATRRGGILGAGRQPQCAGAARPARQRPQGQARAGARRAVRGRHRGGADAVFAVGPARGRQAGVAEAGAVRARRGRGAGRGQPVARPAGRCAARADGGRFLRRRRRQDARSRRGDALERPALCAGYLGPSARCAEAPARPQRPVERLRHRALPTSTTSAYGVSTARSTGCSSMRRVPASARCDAIRTSSGGKRRRRSPSFGYSSGRSWPARRDC